MIIAVVSSKSTEEAMSSIRRLRLSEVENAKYDQNDDNNGQTD